jgi:hypothetical protein
MQYSRMLATAGSILATCAMTASTDAQPLQADPRPTGAQHGSWSQGPGIHTFRICASVVGVRPYDIRDRFEQEGGGGGRAPLCNVTALPGQSIPITIETWGAGGGGGAGGFPGKPANRGGKGGGGGGGGGYGRTVLNVLVPATGAVVYFVGVGTGGAGGQTSGASPDGADGGFTEVRINDANGTLLLKASGGRGGSGGSNAYGNSGASPGTGTINAWPGTQGYNGGLPTSCNGAAGGFGGAGGGPGRTGAPYINDGGNGGAGGYRNQVGCTAHGHEWGRAPGVIGGNGKASFTW